MVEYIYDAIKATAGENASIVAKITNYDGSNIERCDMYIFDNNSEIFSVAGSFDGELWTFNISGQLTDGLKGRYWYEINNGGYSISFKQPIYFV